VTYWLLCVVAVSPVSLFHILIILPTKFFAHFKRLTQDTYGSKSYTGHTEVSEPVETQRWWHTNV